MRFLQLRRAVCRIFFNVAKNIYKRGKTKWVSKGYKPFGGVQRQSLWWGVGKAPQQRKTSKASEAKIYDHSKFTPLGLSNNR